MLMQFTGFMFITGVLLTFGAGIVEAILFLYGLLF